MKKVNELLESYSKKRLMSSFNSSPGDKRIEEIGALKSINSSSSRRGRGPADTESLFSDSTNFEPLVIGPPLLKRRPSVVPSLHFEGLP
jgi:hypothetical protein